jgi:hypothetical protein
VEKGKDLDGSRHEEAEKLLRTEDSMLFSKASVLERFKKFTSRRRFSASCWN